jgi:hypothetical protein
MIRSLLFSGLLAAGFMALTPPAPAQAQVYYFNRATGQWTYDHRPYRPQARLRPRYSLSGADAVYRSCRRQVRRSLGAIPGIRFRPPRQMPFLVDRCVANGGVYS